MSSEQNNGNEDPAVVRRRSKLSELKNLWEGNAESTFQRPSNKSKARASIILLSNQAEALNLSVKNRIATWGDVVKTTTGNQPKTEPVDAIPTAMAMKERIQTWKAVTESQPSVTRRTSAAEPEVATDVKNRIQTWKQVTTSEVQPTNNSATEPTTLEGAADVKTRIKVWKEVTTTPENAENAQPEPSPSQEQAAGDLISEPVELQQLEIKSPILETPKEDTALQKSPTAEGEQVFLRESLESKSPEAVQSVAQTFPEPKTPEEAESVPPTPEEAEPIHQESISPETPEQQEGIQQSPSISSAQPDAPPTESGEGTEQAESEPESMVAEMKNYIRLHMPTDGPTVRCLHDYTALASDELSFTKGQYIHCVQVTDAEWWLGLSEDNEPGLFPANHVVFDS